jgi:hypothetical protein
MHYFELLSLLAARGPSYMNLLFESSKSKSSLLQEYFFLCILASFNSTMNYFLICFKQIVLMKY